MLLFPGQVNEGLRGRLFASNARVSPVASEDRNDRAGLTYWPRQACLKRGNAFVPERGRGPSVPMQESARTSHPLLRHRGTQTWPESMQSSRFSRHEAKSDVMQWRPDPNEPKFAPGNLPPASHSRSRQSGSSFKYRSDSHYSSCCCSRATSSSLPPRNSAYSKGVLPSLSWMETSIPVCFSNRLIVSGLPYRTA